MEIDGEQLGKIEAVHHFVQGADDSVDLLFHQLPESGVAGVQPALRHSFALDAADPAVENQRQRTAVRTGLGGHVPNQLFVGGKSLSLGAL